MATVNMNINIGKVQPRGFRDMRAFRQNTQTQTHRESDIVNPYQLEGQSSGHRRLRYTGVYGILQCITTRRRRRLRRRCVAAGLAMRRYQLAECMHAVECHQVVDRMVAIIRCLVRPFIAAAAAHKTTAT